MADSDNVPLDESPPSSPTGTDHKIRSFDSTDVFLNKTKVIIIAVVIIILVILVIILAALLGAANAKSKDSSTDKTSGGDKTTTNPSDAPPTTPGTEAWWQVRLPKNVIPIHYDLVLDVDLKKSRFEGTVDILANVTSPTNVVIVQVHMLNVTSEKVVKAGADLPLKRQFYFGKNEYYVMELEETVEPTQIHIKMSFWAELTDSMKGLYKSQYQHADGKNVTIAATQLQPTDARRVFPCFDEPAMKATFSVVLVHQPDFISLSNMPIAKSETKGGKMYDYYQETKVMPTYLLAFVICDFKHKSITTKTGVKMGFYAPPDIIDQVDYAVSIGGKIMTFFEEYFDIPFPLPKSDMVAIPDFAAGAMENWGLILYKESALLWKNGSSSARNKQRVAVVVSHELVHQWFGNLVTMEWWDDLWLNEGFATYVEFRGVAHVEPDWAMNEQFVIAEQESAFLLDGLSSSHPIKVDVNHPNEINEIFDSISYNKGGAILRMLENIIGNETFVSGLTKYLKKHAYGNANTDDLWSALKKESCRRGKCIDVKKIMDTWTLQMGYPVLQLIKRNSTHYRVTQKRFLYDAKANVSNSKYKSPFNYTWEVSFTYITSGQSKPATVFLHKGPADIKWDGSGWIKGNHDQNGFYRVNYDAVQWTRLSNQLKTNHKAFSISDRAGFIGDAFNLARANIIDYSVALETTSYLQNETKYVPWEAAISNIDYASSIISITRPAYKYLQKYLAYQAKLEYNKLGFTDTGTHLEKYLRVNVLSIYCSAEEQSCLTKASEYFKKWMENPTKNPVPANFRTLVYYYGVANGGEEQWNFMFEQFKKTNIATEKRKLLYGMAASKEPWILERYLKYSLDTQKVRPQDAMRVATNIANYNDIGRQIAWNFLRRNWETYRKRYGAGFFYFGNLIRSICSGFASEFQLNELIAFSKAHQDSGTGARAMEQAIETVKSNILWLKENENNIEQWLAKYLKDHNIK